MPLNIVKGYRELVAEAEREIETVGIEEALALHGSEDVVFVDGTAVAISVPAPIAPATVYVRVVASGAVVTLYNGDREVGKYKAGVDGFIEGDMWHVFTLDDPSGAVEPASLLHFNHRHREHHNLTGELGGNPQNAGAGTQTNR